MIRQKAEFNNKPIEALLGYLTGYQQVCDQEFDAALVIVEPPMRSELEHEPRVRQWPGDYPQGHLEWTSEKQRKAFWASDGFGRGIGAERTHELSKAWVIAKEGGGVHIVMRVQNPDPAAKWAYGSLAKSNPGRFQQGFHAITGWQRAYDTVQFWLEALWEQYVANMHARLGDTLNGTVTTRQRAYTSRTAA